MKNNEIKQNTPIGLIPRKNATELRYLDVCGAIKRYYEAGLKIPVEWIEEYNDLIILKHFINNEESKDK